MPRIIEMTVEPDRTDDLLHRLGDIDGIVGITVDRGAGFRPAADVVRLSTTNRGARSLMVSMAEPQNLGVLTLASSEPLAMLSPKHQGELDRESTESTWADVAGHLREESNAELNILLLMFLSGAIAAIGIGTDVIHLVIGAMVVTPGFEPFLRMPFSLIVGSYGSFRQALFVTVSGYVLMALGAAAAYRLIDAVQVIPPLESLPLVQYWTTLDSVSVLVAVVAGLAGAVTVTANRAVFTAGVMIALALVPGMALVGVGLAAGDPSIAQDGATQWALNGVVVILTATLVIGLKHLLMHGRAGTP